MHSLLTYTIQHIKKKANFSVNDTDKRLEETYKNVRNMTKHIKYFNYNNIKLSNKSTAPKQASSFHSSVSSSQIQLISTSSLDSITSPSYSINNNNTQSPSNSQSPHYKLTTMECTRSYTYTFGNNDKLSKQYIEVNTLGNTTSLYSDDSYCIDTFELIDNAQIHEYFNTLQSDIERDYGYDSLDSITNLFSTITLLGDDNKIDINSIPINNNIDIESDHLRIQLVNHENDYYNHKYLSISNDVTINFYPKSNRYCDSIKNGNDNDPTIELINNENNDYCIPNDINIDFYAHSHTVESEVIVFTASEANDDFEDKSFGCDTKINEPMGSESSSNNQLLTAELLAQHNKPYVSLTAELLAQHNKPYEHTQTSISSSDDDDILQHIGKELLLMNDILQPIGKEFKNNNIDIDDKYILSDGDRFSRIGSVLLNGNVFEYDDEEEKIYENNNNNIQKKGIDIDHAYQLIQFINNNNSYNIFGFTDDTTSKNELIDFIIDNTDTDAYQLFILINKTHNNHNNNNNNERNNIYGFDMNYVWPLSTGKEMINEKGSALVEDKIYDNDNDDRTPNFISIDMDDIWLLSDQPIVNENEEHETNDILSLGELYNNYFKQFKYTPKTLQKFVNYVQSHENNSYRYIDIKIWWSK